VVRAARRGEVAGPTGLTIRLLRESDLPAAKAICGTAFSAFLRTPNQPTDADALRVRWNIDPASAFAAELDGELVGSNFAVNWGSLGFFGPLTVHPDLWNHRIAQRLLEPTMELFASWGARHVGLYTFAHSPKHLALYQKFGFWPGTLAAAMSKIPSPSKPAPGWSRYSALPAAEQAACLQECRDVAGSVFEGLDLSAEIRALAEQDVGDTVLIWGRSRLAAFAVCHSGPGSEAGSGQCYVKFGVARAGSNSGAEFVRLLEACEALAAAYGAARLVAGMNYGRPEACQTMMAQGFRADFSGVVMDRPNEPGYNRSGVYLIDDWR
jgi:GNAT superfamily N-acetyltransferase